MKATPDDLSALFDIQQMEIEILRKNKQLEELPQRELILELREKKDKLVAQAAKVAKLKKDVVHRLNRMKDEDASLAKKEAGVQAAIEAAHGDYRNVEARTKELDGIFRRRKTVAEETAGIQAELDKLEALEAQIARADEDVVTKEEQTIDSFKAEGGALKQQIANLEAKRDKAAAGVDPEVYAKFEKVAKRVGGVGIGKLDGTRCGVCRAPIDGGRLIELKAQAPLGTCPHCQRLLIIEE